MAGTGTAVEVANKQLTCHVNASCLTALTALHEASAAAAPSPGQSTSPPVLETPTVKGGVLHQLQPNAFASSSNHDEQEEHPTGGRWFGRQGPGSTDSSEDPSSSRDPSEPGALRSPQVIENFVAPGAGGTPQATGALDLDIWHTDGDWEAPDHYGHWFVVPEGQAAFAVAVSHDGGNAAEEEAEEALPAPHGSLMPAALYPDYVSAGPALTRGAGAPKPLCARCAIAPLGPLFPSSRVRVVVRDMSVLVRLLRSGQAMSAEAASAVVEVDAPRVCLQLDVFAPRQLYVRCLSIAVHELELRDWGVHGDPATVPRVLLGPFSLNRAPSGGDACVVHVVLQEVRPDLQHGEVETRLTAACAALRVQLDQGALLLMEELASGLGGGEEDVVDGGACVLYIAYSVVVHSCVCMRP